MRDKYRKAGLSVLARLGQGPATTSDLTTHIYRRDDLAARRAIWVVIHRLRSNGYPITQESKGQASRRYVLAGDGPILCPYCAGTGRTGGAHATW